MTSDGPGAWDTPYHAPVLAEEILELLREARTVLDCTLGGGGHCAALLAMGASVTAIDRDPAAIDEATRRLAAQHGDGRFQVILGNFADVDRLLPDASQKFDGIVADLGVSSHQIDDASRGFSFRQGSPLDMRMGDRSLPGAGDFLNTADEAQIASAFRDYGDEPRARRLAREVVRRRQNRLFETSDDLVGAVRGAFGPRTGPADFARLFQSIRIAVNDEVAALEKALPALRNRLIPGGTLAVIAYHSGEDRVVKNAMRDWSRDCICPPRQLQCTCRGKPLGRVVTRKPVAPSSQEIARNPRARSAHLRAWRSDG